MTDTGDHAIHGGGGSGAYSIITNYGCHWLCPYCVVKNNGIGIPETDETADSRTVERLAASGMMGSLSISGGGDPLFRADTARLDWYRSLARTVHDAGGRFSLHTSYKRSILNREPVDFDRISYHCLKREQLGMIRRVNDEIVRAVFVVQDFMDEDYIRGIVEDVKGSGLITELSFRQRIDPGYRINHHLHGFLKAGHGTDWWYIEQDDYNKYIVNGMISDKYEDFVVGHGKTAPMTGTVRHPVRWMSPIARDDGDGARKTVLEGDPT